MACTPSPGPSPTTSARPKASAAATSGSRTASAPSPQRLDGRRADRQQRGARGRAGRSHAGRSAGVGWDPAAPWRAFAVERLRARDRAQRRGGPARSCSCRAEPGGSYDGYLRVGDALAPLPVGSQLDPATGVFTWQPASALSAATISSSSARDGRSRASRGRTSASSCRPRGADSSDRRS